MAKFAKKVMEAAIGAEKIFGTDKLTSGIYDKYLGTDIQGAKADQAAAKERERQLNEQALQGQENMNIIGTQGTENIAQVEAGGTAADVAGMDDTKRRRANSISSTLGI